VNINIRDINSDISATTSHYISNERHHQTSHQVFQKERKRERLYYIN